MPSMPFKVSYVCDDRSRIQESTLESMEEHGGIQFFMPSMPSKVSLCL